MTAYPVFDSNAADATRDVIASPIGTAASPEEAMSIVSKFLANADDGGDPIAVYGVELEERFGVTGWFPVWA